MTKKKGDRAKGRRIRLQVDDINLPMWPATLTIANLLPGDVATPDFHTADPWHETPAEAAEFERFLDEQFPREKFPKFRQAVDNPYLDWNAGVKRHTKLQNYRYIVGIRDRYRGAAQVQSLIAVITNDRLPPLRICEWCKSLFIAYRSDTKTCSTKCGDARRQANWRAKAKDYEVARQRKLSAKDDERKLKGGPRK